MRRYAVDEASIVNLVNHRRANGGECYESLSLSYNSTPIFCDALPSRLLSAFKGAERSRFTIEPDHSSIHTLVHSGHLHGRHARRRATIDFRFRLLER